MLSVARRATRRDQRALRLLPRRRCVNRLWVETAKFWSNAVDGNVRDSLGVHPCDPCNRSHFPNDGNQLIASVGDKAVASLHHGGRRGVRATTKPVRSAGFLLFENTENTEEDAELNPLSSSKKQDAANRSASIPSLAFRDGLSTGTRACAWQLASAIRNETQASWLRGLRGKAKRCLQASQCRV